MSIQNNNNTNLIQYIVLQQSSLPFSSHLSPTNNNHIYPLVNNHNNHNNQQLFQSIPSLTMPSFLPNIQQNMQTSLVIPAQSFIHYQQHQQHPHSAIMVTSTSNMPTLQNMNLHQNALEIKAEALAQTNPANPNMATLQNRNLHRNPPETKTDGFIGTNSTNLNMYKCPECNKTFKHETNLNIHSRIHTSSAFICPVCVKPFARNTNLRQHLRVHTGEKPFKCSYCIKAFKQKHSLIDHTRIHTGEKPYICEFCGKQFTARGNYMVHRRIHTGEKPYECDICQKKFASKSGYNSHRKHRHSN